MKKRISSIPIRVAFGFNGVLQDDLEAYQGFMEVADPEGWQVVPLYENFEGRLRKLVSAGAVEGMVGKFISEAWLQGLSRTLPCVHLGASPLGSVPSVIPDTEHLGRLAAEHFRVCGYPEIVWFSPRKVPGIPEGMRDRTGGGVVEIRTLEALRCHLQASRETGVFCLTDFHARQVVSLCSRLNVRIPDPVGVLGIGDRFWDGVVAGRPLSSIPVPHRRMGVAAARLLRDLFAGNPTACVRIPPGSVRARESTRLPVKGTGLQLQVRGWLEDRLEDPPSMDELARRAGMSRRGFERAFAAAAGATPYEYLLRMRTGEALRLLRETDRPVGRIGLEIGIPEPARFSAFLRKRTGKSPRKWRHSASGLDSK